MGPTFEDILWLVLLSWKAPCPVLDFYKIASLNRNCRAITKDSASVQRLEVTHERNLAGAIAFAGSALRELRLSFDAHGGPVYLNVADLAGLERLAPNSVTLDVREEETVSWNFNPDGIDTDRLVTTYLAIAAMPAVRQLRLTNFTLARRTMNVMRHPKVALTGVLDIGHTLHRARATAEDVLRHEGVHTLVLRDVVPCQELLAATRARHLHMQFVEEVEVDDVRFARRWDNPHIKELSWTFVSHEGALALAHMLHQSHDYADGFTMHHSNLYFAEVYVVDPEIARALTAAFEFPGFRVGNALTVDTCYAISDMAVPDDGLLGAVAACASRSTELRELNVFISGVPAAGPGVFALLRLPEHVQEVTITSHEEEDMTFGPIMDELNVDRCQNWVVAALAGACLPGTKKLVITCHTGAFYFYDPDAYLAWENAGRALARAAPRLELLDISVFDEFGDGDIEWPVHFERGFAREGARSERFESSKWKTFEWKK